MKSSELIKVSTVYIAPAIVAAFLYLLFRPTAGASNRPAVVTLRNAASIAYALYGYKSDHAGHLPARLSDLVPRYIATTNIDLFFFPRKVTAAANPSLEAVAREIDNGAAFMYLGERGLEKDLIMYERTNFWGKDGHAASVVTLTTNLTIKRLPPNVIEARLSR